MAPAEVAGEASERSTTGTTYDATAEALAEGGEQQPRTAPCRTRMPVWIFVIAVPAIDLDVRDAVRLRPMVDPITFHDGQRAFCIEERRRLGLGGTEGGGARFKH